MAVQKETLKRQTSAIQRIRNASPKLENADATAFLSKFFLLCHQTRYWKGLDGVANDSSAVSQRTNNRQITMEGFRSLGIMVSV